MHAQADINSSTAHPSSPSRSTRSEHGWPKTDTLQIPLPAPVSLILGQLDAALPLPFHLSMCKPIVLSYRFACLCPLAFVTFVRAAVANATSHAIAILGRPPSCGQHNVPKCPRLLYHPSPEYLHTLPTQTFMTGSLWGDAPHTTHITVDVLLVAYYTGLRKNNLASVQLPWKCGLPLSSPPAPSSPRPLPFSPSPKHETPFALSLVPLICLPLGQTLTTLQGRTAHNPGRCGRMSPQAVPRLRLSLLSEEGPEKCRSKRKVRLPAPLQG